MAETGPTEKGDDNKKEAEKGDEGSFVPKPPTPPPYVPDSQRLEIAAEIARRRRTGLNAALQSTTETFQPPLPLSTPPAGTDAPQPQQTGAATLTPEGELTSAADVLPAPIPVTPTVYPEHPNGAVTVVNFITVNTPKC